MWRADWRSGLGWSVISQIAHRGLRRTGDAVGHLWLRLLHARFDRRVRRGGRLRLYRLGAEVFRGFETLLDGTAKHGSLTVQRQQQSDFAGGSWFKTLYIDELRRQHFRPRILRVAFLPVGDPGFQHVWIVAVVKPDALQIQPALKHIFIGVDNQRPGLIRRHGGERLPGGVDIFLFLFRRQ